MNFFGKMLGPALILVTVIWIVEAVNLVMGHGLATWGILPRSLSGLIGIPLAPFKAIDGPVPDWPVIGFIVAVHLMALSAFLPMTFSWPAVGVAFFLHRLTGGVGVTLGYHRLITHRSFQVPKWVEYGLLFCATLSCQSPIEWVRTLGLATKVVLPSRHVS